MASARHLTSFKLYGWQSARATKTEQYNWCSDCVWESQNQRQMQCSICRLTFSRFFFLLSHLWIWGQGCLRLTGSRIVRCIVCHTHCHISFCFVHAIFLLFRLLLHLLLTFDTLVFSTALSCSPPFSLYINCNLESETKCRERVHFKADQTLTQQTAHAFNSVS